MEGYLNLGGDNIDAAAAAAAAGGFENLTYTKNREP